MIYKLNFCFLSLLSMVLLLSGCDRFGDSNLPQPAPLKPIQALIHGKVMWSYDIGLNQEDLKFSIALDSEYQHLFIATPKGSVFALAADTGHLIWRKDLDTLLTSGVGQGSNLLLVGSQQGIYYALNKATGALEWKAELTAPSLAPASFISDKVLIKTIDDQVWALDNKTGKTLWTFSSGYPQLILRFGSSPRAVGNKVIIGLASGKIFAISLNDGSILWEQTIGFAEGATDVQQMVDIDVNPYIDQGEVYIAAYQGMLACLQFSTGNFIWKHPLSSYTGMVLDDQDLFITDEKGYLWDFNKRNGAVRWKQDQLLYRNLTAPVLLKNMIVVGDGEGYLHFLSKETGQFQGRVAISQQAIVSSPLVKGSSVYILNQAGRIFRYKLDQ